MFHFPGIVDSFPALGLFVLLLLGVVGFPFPEDAILLTGGFLIARGSARPALILISVYSGLLLTDFLLYSVGRKYGRMVITHRRFSRLLSSERLSRMERAFNRKGVLVILLGRQILGIRSQVLLSAGVMKMPSRRFFFSDAVSAMVTITLIGGAGYLGGHNLEALRRHISGISLDVLICLSILLAAYLFFRYVRSRRGLPKPPELG